MQTKVGEIKFKETMEGTQSMNIPGYPKEFKKSNLRTMKYYRNKNVITCVMTKGGFKGVGIAKCNSKDNFDYSKGIRLAEMRARSNYYKDIANFLSRMF